jgi:hypothetical protein
MSASDPRAVENPISAIFDLAEDVNKEAPRLRKLVWYAGIFVGAWLVLDFILILQNVVHSFVMGLIFIALFALGVWTLLTLRRLNDFLDYYTLRHSVILSIRQDDPVVFAPQGSNAVERLRSHLANRNPSMAVALRTEGQTPAVLKGKGGMLYNFDYYLRSRSGPLWRLFGIGYPGYQMFIKQVDKAPTVETFWSMVRAVEDVCRQNKSPPSRVIVLWKRAEGEDLGDEAYEHLTSSAIRFQHYLRRYASSLELIIENEDGSYEFIPYVADGHFSASRAQ